MCNTNIYGDVKSVIFELFRFVFSLSAFDPEIFYKRRVHCLCIYLSVFKYNSGERAEAVKAEKIE